MSPGNFGPKLALILKQLGMSQIELATRSGITPAAVSMILDGKREPSLGTIVAILKIIPVKFETLVGDKK